MLRKNYYLTLGVSRTESSEGIHRAFCNLVKRYHPDRVGLMGLSFFHEIVKAYRVLGDPQRRLQYDEGLAHGEASAALLRPVVVHSGTEPGSLVPEIGLPLQVDIMRPSFEAAFARVARHLNGVGSPREERLEGVEAQVILPRHVAARGGIAFVTVPTCSPCQKCGGLGEDGLFPCSFCQGEGLSEEDETLCIQIPPMVGDGRLMEIPLRGLGVHNFYLRLHIRVGSEPTSASASDAAQSRRAGRDESLKRWS
jgi:DnaJ-class molecular chaperone